MDRMTKRMTYEDKFARRFWGKKARRNYIRHAKRQNRRILRQKLKQMPV